MTAPAETKQERINLRLRHHAKQLLERAASFEGKSVSSFILSSALSRAEETIHAHQVMTLNARDSAAFFDALAKPVKFNDALTQALEQHDRQVISK